MKVAKDPNKRTFYRRNVDGRLYTGKPIESVSKCYKMKKAGVTQVIDLRDADAVSRAVEQILCRMFGIKYRNIKVKTDTNDIPPAELFKKVNAIIVQNIGDTYLHCKFGRHRTGMCVAAYEQEVLKKDKGHIIDELANNFADALGNHGDKRLQKKLGVVLNKFAKKHLMDCKTLAII